MYRECLIDSVCGKSIFVLVTLDPLAIIYGLSMGDVKGIGDVVSYEFLDIIPCNLTCWNYFKPFGEVMSGANGEFKFILG